MTAIPDRDAVSEKKHQMEESVHPSVVTQVIIVTPQWIIFSDLSPTFIS